jgi:hypothetical protein
MAWETEMVTILRSIVGDLSSPQEFSDSSLQQLIVSAGQLMILDIDFPKTYTFDHSTPDITPDPTDPARDDAFINLAVLKAACLLGIGQWRNKARQSMVVKDDVSLIDGRKVGEGTQAWAQDLCKAYEDAKMDYRLGNAKPGAAIVGPHMADDNFRTTYTHSHRGGYHH